MKIKLLILGFLVLLLFLQGAAEGSAADGSQTALPPLSFREASRRIDAYYPRLKSQKARVDQAVAEKLEAYAELLPVVTGSSALTVGDDPVYAFGALLRQEQFSASNFGLDSLNSPRHRTNFNFTLSGEMPLFNAFQTFSRIRTSKHLLRSEIDQEKFIAMEAALLSLESYLKSLVLRENVKTIRQIKEAAFNDLKQAEELKNQGMVLGADFYAAKIVYSGIRRLENQILGDAQTAEALLAILMGDPPGAQYQLIGILPGDLPADVPLEEWMVRAAEFRPDVLAFEGKVKAQKQAVFRKKMSALPQITAFAEVTEDTHDLRTGGENYMMGLRGRMALLDASYWAQRKKAAAQYREMEEHFRAFKDEVKKDVAGAESRFETLRQDLPIIEETYHDAQEAMKQTEILYREGRKSIFDLLQIRHAFLQTELQRNQIRMESQTAYANLLFLTGTLDETAIGELAGRIDQPS